MAVPTREEFDDLLELLKDLDAVELKGKERNLSLPHKFEDIYDFFIQIYNIWWSKREPIKNSSVMKWLQAQQHFTLGIQAAFGKGKTPFIDDNWKQSNHELATEEARSLLDFYKPINKAQFHEKIVKHNADGTYQMRNGSVVSSVEEYNVENATYIPISLFTRANFPSVETRWLIAFVEALNSYFYGEFSHIGDHYVGNAEDIDATTQATKLLIESISYSLPGSKYFGAEKLLKELEMFSCHMQLMTVLAKAYTPPIKRKNESIKERALAYDLWINFKKHKLGSKVSAIYHFLSLTGSINIVDRRTLERNVERWEMERKETERRQNEVFRGFLGDAFTCRVWP